MPDLNSKRIDFLVIGHVARDLVPRGAILGGTAAYASRTASAFGLRVGIVTSSEPNFDLQPLDHLNIFNVPSENTTTFENRYSPQGRQQILRGVATLLTLSSIPAAWRSTPIVHLGPIADEVDLALIDHFPDALVGVTPQGWLRKRDDDGRVQKTHWRRLVPLLPRIDAMVLSLEDLDGDRHAGQELANFCKIVVVTEGADGAHMYCERHERHFPAPILEEQDPTGAGDVFAAAFFIHLQRTGDPCSAARIATLLAANSITRWGVDSTPTVAEVRNAQAQVIS
jgi:sugar/nucleoside kinase (ribokinase family)